MLLCLPLLDDAALRRLLPPRLVALMPARAKNQAPRRAVTIAVNAAALMLVALSLVQMDERFGGSPPAPAAAIDDLFEPFHLTSPYGLFAVMTTTRDEIIVEGSDDGVQWREYEFRYKPGDVNRRPPWNIPISRGSTGRCGSPRLTSRNRIRGFRGFSSASCRTSRR